jgi:predicted ATPase
MRENWLAEIYRSIKKARDERLSRALILLGKKAVSDPEIAEALRLLSSWAPGQEHDDETTTKNKQNYIM